ncbi:hypothetical protein H4582DRAFT_2101246 [Lactarius indigo]|nr:hypothetical protein H4582DRAFT_2101246 [Lactarius indigo]
MRPMATPLAPSLLIAKAISSKISSWVLSQTLNLNQTIKCLRLARVQKPDLQVAHTALALCLGIRYVMTFVDDDYEEAASILDESIHFQFPQNGGAPIEDSPDPRVFRGGAISCSCISRLTFCQIASLILLSLINLEDIAKQRFRYFGHIEGLEASSSNSQLSRPVSLLASQGGDLEISPLLKTMELLGELRSGVRNNDITKIDEALEKGRIILASSASRHPLTSYLIEFFGSFLFEAFKRTNKIEYLNESTNTYRQASSHVFEHQSMQFRRFPTTSSAFTGFGYALCIGSRSAYQWASFARGFRRTFESVSTAYESAMVLMQDTLLFAPTLQLQHATLVKLPDESHRMPLDYASYWINLHQLGQAIQTLERGRALLWSQMSHFRTSVDQLLEVDPDLAYKFAAAFPGFHGFLESPLFDTLRSAASSGPVIIINHSSWRSDILVLHNASPSIITTPHDFYDRARGLKDKLSDSRHKYGLSSREYDETLASVLAELYELVGKACYQPTPVSFKYQNSPGSGGARHPCFFRSLSMPWVRFQLMTGEKRYFLDLYICSYTPTLSALIRSRDRGPSPQSLGRPSLLLVAQPDLSLPTVGGEIQVIQALDAEVTGLISEAATPAAEKPFDAGFELHGGERLTLLEIVRSDLPTAEFAFLSACHTAEYCGFKSVIGTMWAMVDEDGRDLAKHFYKALFSTSRRTEGIPYHERSAKALQFAVKKLRRKRHISLERWVNFVHYGA